MYPFAQNTSEVIDLDEDSYPQISQPFGGYSTELYNQTTQILNMLQNPYASLAFLLSSY
jgi:hypothetical protein